MLVEYWFFVLDDNVNQIGKTEACNDHPCHLRIYPTNTLIFEDTNLVQIGSISITINTWHHIAITQSDTSGMEIVVDKYRYLITGYTNVIPGRRSWRIATNKFHGYKYFLRIWVYDDADADDIKVMWKKYSRRYISSG